MSELSRRTFLKGAGASTAALGMGLSGAAWAQTGRAKPIGVSGKTMDVDLAVAGGGCAGMAAAVTAANADLKVAVFEKQATLAAGGNGPFAVESRMQRERHLTYTVKDALEFYCAGNDVNSICGGSYPFYLCGHTSGFAYNTGRIAGENASNYIKGQKS